MTQRKRVIGLAALGCVALVAILWLAVRPRATLGAKVRARAEQALARVAPATELGPDVHVSFSGNITVGPVALHLTDATTPAEVSIDRVVISPAFASLFGSHPRVAHVHLEGVHVDLGDSVTDARATIDRYRAWRAARPAKEDLAREPNETPTLSAEDIYLALPVNAASAEARTLAIATLEAAANCTNGCNAGVSADLATGGRLTASISEKRDADVSVIVDTHGIDIDVAALPKAIIAALPLAIDKGHIDASLSS